MEKKKSKPPLKTTLRIWRPTMQQLPRMNMPNFQDFKELKMTLIEVTEEVAEEEAAEAKEEEEVALLEVEEDTKVLMSMKMLSQLFERADLNKVNMKNTRPSIQQPIFKE